MGDAFVLCCDSSYVFGVVDVFVLYSFICASKSNLFIDIEKFYILKLETPKKFIRWWFVMGINTHISKFILKVPER